MMYKDIIHSFFYHLVVFILFTVSSLFFYKKVDLQQINVTLVSGYNKGNKYTPLVLSKEDLQNNTKFKKVLDINTDLTTNSGVGDNLKLNESLNLKNNIKEVEKIIPQNEVSKNAHKDNIVTQNNYTDQSNIHNNVDQLENFEKKELFINKMISGLDKGKLTHQELIALHNQIKGCWYGQGGYSSKEDLKVELLLTMNADATINHIEILNEETYNTPVRKTFLEQVLRALKDPRCRQLTLPKGGYNNWKIIHIIFDPKG